MKKGFKIAGIIMGVIILILIFMITFPFIFKEKFGELVKTTANRKLKTELTFREMDVSFFSHFPHLTISLSDMCLMSSAPFERDTLISASEVSFGVDLVSIFSQPIRINRIYVDRGRIVVAYNEKGEENFNVYAETDTTVRVKSDTASSAEIKIEDITFSNSDFFYRDPAVPLHINAFGINYKGKSELTGDIFKLLSKVTIDSCSVVYNTVPYLQSKPLTADLATSVNTESLEISLDRNDLFVKEIPFSFNGKFSFRKDGYELVLKLKSEYQNESFSASLKLISTEGVWIFARSRFDIDLQKWSQGLGVKDFETGGRLKFDLVASGEYTVGQNPKSATPDTVITSVPEFSFGATLTNGYFKFRQLPEAIRDISVKLEVSLEGNDYRNIKVDAENLKASMLGNRFEGFLHLDGLEKIKADGQLKSSINLADIGKAIPLDSLNLSGQLFVEATVNGTYTPGGKTFPVADVSLRVTDASIQTKYYPDPIRKIGLNSHVINRTGALKDTKVTIDPLTFEFEGNPFMLSAGFDNPDNVAYNIKASGSIELGKIYHVFAIPGTGLRGFIKPDLKLKGVQSDVLAGKFGNLQNSGSLELKEIALTSGLLPKEFILASGLFRFDREKVWFDQFKGKYGRSDIMMEGHLDNVIRYIFDDKSVINGNFTFISNLIDLDEFMAPAENQVPARTDSGSKQVSSPAISSPGVIVIPENLNIALKSSLKQILFRKLELKDLNAQIALNKGLLIVKNISLDLIGCKMSLDLTYGSFSPVRGHFDFHVSARDFDVKRAYNEIELFRNLSTVAGKCEGLISMDYSLKGVVGAGMMPIYSSLEGGGVITAKKIKVMGLKILNSMSRNLQKEKIANPDLSKIELKTTIKNNVVTLERTKIKMSGFRFRMEGETNFNGALNLKTRLGLPPLGLVGIPIRILGTHEDPKFRYGRGTTDEGVEETRYSEEIPPDLLEKIKNTKDADDPD